MGTNGLRQWREGGRGFCLEAGKPQSQPVRLGKTWTAPYRIAWHTGGISSRYLSGRIGDNATGSHLFTESYGRHPRIGWTQKAEGRFRKASVRSHARLAAAGL